MRWELLVPPGVCAGHVRGIALEGTHAFARDEAGVVRFDLATRAHERIFARRVSHVAAANGRAAWTETSGEIVSWSDAHAEVVARDVDRPWSVAFDAERVIWASVVLVDGMTMNDRGSVRCVDLATGVVRSLAERLYQPDFVTLFRGDVLFASAGYIVRCTGGALETVAEAAGDINGIALADTRLVWIDDGDDSSIRALAPEHGAETLAYCEDQPVEIAAAEDHVVWVESDGYLPHKAFELRLNDRVRTPIEPPCDDPGYAIATNGRTVLWAMSDASIWRR